MSPNTQDTAGQNSNTDDVRHRRLSLAELAYRWPVAPTPADHADPNGPNGVPVPVVGSGSVGDWQPPIPMPPLAPWVA